MAIGQKLEEARNRKGISLREASESTKIRGDYLSAFESSSFDINLPEVYLRGFVRLYARFLDLDQEAVLADLDLELGNISAKSSKKSLGSISNNEKDGSDFSNSGSSTKAISNNRAYSIRKPIIYTFASILSITILISILIYAFTGDSSKETPPLTPLNGNGIKETQANTLLNSPSDKNVDPSDSFILRVAAIGPISLLIIDDQGDGIPKDFKDLDVGWETEIPIIKSFRCHCSDLENLRFAIDDGKEKKVDGKGAGNFSWSP